MNYWYVSRENEIFIDTDNFYRSIKHTNSRLVGAIQGNRLDVSKVEFHASNSENHVHTLITLAGPLSAIERYVWALILHGDIYRACATIMREIHGVPCPDILITPKKFDREPDNFCQCETKHNRETMLQCPAAIKLRGDKRTKGFFGKPSISRTPDFFGIYTDQEEMFH